MKQIVIWAHGVCRSTMALYREITQQAEVPVTIALLRYGESDDTRKRREKCGQRVDEYDDLGFVAIGDDIGVGRLLLEKSKGEGAVHIFSGYQVSPVCRTLIKEAKESGAFVAIYDEAPCEMCLDFMAVIKRMYYKFVLPKIVKDVPPCADLFLNASGKKNIDRLMRLGWRPDQIASFGYASEKVERVGHVTGRREFRILHTGIETPYRSVDTLRMAVGLLNKKGYRIDLFCTGGLAPVCDMEKFYAHADLFVACGLCEPWGMRVNDAIHAGLPVVVSSGMGARLIVDETGCGSVFNAGNVKSLAGAIAKFVDDPKFLERCRSMATIASAKWSPEYKAREVLDLIKRGVYANH